MAFNLSEEEVAITRRKYASRSIVALVTVAALTALNGYEGNETQSYSDTVGVYTICRGVTRIPGVGRVQPGMKLTESQCNDLNKAVVSGFVKDVAALIKVPISVQSMTAHVTFAYNIGIPGYKSSSALRLTNQKHYTAGCRAMMNWHSAGGKDCRIRANNCHGLITRRENEVRECLSGS